MTDLELIEILERPMSTLEKALAIRTALKATAPSALNIKPKQERKKREAKATKVQVSQPTFTNGADDHGEAH